MTKKPVISNRERYTQEYDELIIRRKTWAFKAMGYLQSLVHMDQRHFGESTKIRIKSIVMEYNKVSEELDHIGSLLDLIDHNESSDFGEW